MNFFKMITEALLALPLLATPATAHADNNPALHGYGQNEIKICYKKETLDIKSSQLTKYLNKGATLGKCPKKVEDKEDKKNDDKKDDKKENNRDN